MSELLVVGFKGTYRAAEVLEELEAMDAARWIHLADAVAVYRSSDGKLRVDKSVRPTTKDGVLGGAALGGLLGALLLAPFTAGTSAALAAAAVGGGAATLSVAGALGGGLEAQRRKEAAGISEDFVKEVSGVLQPGQSAVFALATLVDLPAVMEHFQGCGGRVIRSTLSATDVTTWETTMAALHGDAVTRPY